jgi:putative peptidoglycan lipid II flippase
MAASRVLGFLRNSVISAAFGQNRLTDMLNTSFVIPDTIYLILVGGGVSSAFIPVLSRYLAQQDEHEVWWMVSTALNFVALVVGTAVTMAALFAFPLVHWIAPGFSPDQVSYTAGLTRIVLLSVIFHSLNGVLMGVEYAHQSFIGTSVGPLVYNSAIIALGVALIKPLGIQAFALSTLAGAFRNFVIQVWGVLRLRPRYYPVLDLKHPVSARWGS